MGKSTEYVKKMIKKALGKKVSEEELRNLQNRKALLDQKNFEVFVIRNEYLNYVNLVLGKYGCDSAKQYDIHLGTGEINESVPVKDTK